MSLIETRAMLQQQVQKLMLERVQLESHFNLYKMRGDREREEKVGGR
jgi:hypothetical protein